MTTRTTTHFLRTEAGAGSLLAVAAIVAVLWANSPWSPIYFGFLEAKVPVRIGGWAETHSVLEWIKEGLMAVFFLVVGLEIKHEVLRGELSNPRKLALPVIAAIGGMAVPALIYLAVNAVPGGDMRGWSAPVATDIAFALAALAAVGRGLPPSLRIFLLTLAIVDDLGAVLIIAFAYSGAPDWTALGGAAAVLVAMALLGRWRRPNMVLWTAGFLLVWALFLRSGVSTSMAGVLSAMTVPVQSRTEGRPGPLKESMEALHPYVAFLILPLFAFAAAGLDVRGGGASPLSPPALGVILGLVAGKGLGVFGAAWLAVRTGLAHRPTGAEWRELFGVSLLCGVGFTMSLFLAALAFPYGEASLESVKLGVLSGSVLAVLCGWAVLIPSARRRRNSRAQAEDDPSAA